MTVPLSRKKTESKYFSSIQDESSFEMESVLMPSLTTTNTSTKKAPLVHKENTWITSPPRSHEKSSTRRRKREQKLETSPNTKPPKRPMTTFHNDSITNIIAKVKQQSTKKNPIESILKKFSNDEVVLEAEAFVIPDSDVSCTGVDENDDTMIDSEDEQIEDDTTSDSIICIGSENAIEKKPKFAPLHFSDAEDTSIDVISSTDSTKFDSSVFPQPLEEKVAVIPHKKVQLHTKPLFQSKDVPYLLSHPNKTTNTTKKKKTNLPLPAESEHSDSPLLGNLPNSPSTTSHHPNNLKRATRQKARRVSKYNFRDKSKSSYTKYL
mmetsp:Transcript_2399/g.3487  ORF Transcript_2399/g.3487 Transcript_2399/m.3487 type:complete len:322 (+) Transcript_2399:58-1023(+)